MPEKKSFYGWWVVAASFLTFGLSVGLPYYNISFFYDYFQKEYGWSLPEITLGFPLAALPTIIIAPLVIHRFSPRKLILTGTGLTCVSFLIFGNMGSGAGTSIWIYYLAWMIYTVGYIFSGPIPHQIIIAQWFRKNRGKAMGVLYVGVGIIGFLGSFLVKPITEALGFHTALIILGCMVLLAWPLVTMVTRDKPAEKGQYPDGAATPPAEISAKAKTFKQLTSRYSFWLLVLGSMCSIGSIGAVNFLMKLVFKENMDPSITDPQQAQVLLNSTWRSAQMIILASSIGGRLLIGGLSDKFNKKIVMTASYFLSAATILLLITVRPPTTPYLFAILFGFAMGADYMLIPLMAAEQFGVNSLARAMAIILPANTLAQTWFPYLTSVLQRQFGNFTYPLYIVFAVGVMSGISIALMPKREPEEDNEALPLPKSTGTGDKR
jgi:MFS family permease